MLVAEMKKRLSHYSNSDTIKVRIDGVLYEVKNIDRVQTDMGYGEVIVIGVQI